MNGKIKLGFIGLGVMGRAHIQVIQSRFASEAEVVAVCDRNVGELERGRTLAPEAKAITNWQDMLSEQIDGVILATPGFLHTEMSLAALQAGIHVLSEKPVASTRADCLKMVAAAENSAKTLMIGHEYRHSRYWRKVKQIIGSGTIGTPWLIWCRTFRFRFHRKIDNWIQDRCLTGGALVEKCCHEFDLMNWFLGRRATRVAAFAGTDAVRTLSKDREIEDNAAVIVDYQNRARATLSLCLFAPYAALPESALCVCGDQGLLEASTQSEEIRVMLREREEDLTEVDRTFHLKQEGIETVRHQVPGPKSGGKPGFEEEHAAFLNAIRSGEPTASDIKHCVDGTLIALAAEQSIDDGRIGELEYSTKAKQLPMVSR